MLNLCRRLEALLLDLLYAFLRGLDLCLQVLVLATQIGQLAVLWGEFRLLQRPAERLLGKRSYLLLRPTQCAENLLWRLRLKLLNGIFQLRLQRLRLLARLGGLLRT